jgi:signal recognition particle receptor subunit alpha
MDVGNFICSSDVGASKKKPMKKAMRTWDDSFPGVDDGVNLDYSSGKIPDAATAVDVSHLIDESSRGVVGNNGLYEVKDLDFGLIEEDEEEDIIARALSGTSLGRSSASSQEAPRAFSRFSTLGNLFSRVTGSMTITKQDLDPVLAGMMDHLMQKNVAKEIATKICEGIGESLVGKRVSGFRGAHLFLPVFTPRIILNSFTIRRGQNGSPKGPLQRDHTHSHPQNIHRSSPGDSHQARHELRTLC